jgi:hypothetical protein
MWGAQMNGHGCGGRRGLVLLPEDCPSKGIFCIPSFSISLSLFSSMIALSTNFLKILIVGVE